MIQIGKINAELVNTGFSDGKFNMDYDLDLVRQIKDGRKPVFRIYGWKPWCLSLGKNQTLEEINQDALQNDSHDYVYRPTGGRAVFHSNELTYCLVTKINKGQEKEIYRDVHLFFSEVLNSLGIISDFVKVDANFHQVYKDKKSVSCFASAARNELTIDGKKIIGSAQRVIGDVLLQHGSLPIDNSYLDIAKYSNSSNQEKLVNYLKSVSTSLQNHSSNQIDFDVLVREIESRDN